MVMAILWRKQHQGKNYEVRTAGQSRRLYTDGVFHTQYNPQRFLTGNVWDLLSLPSLFLAPAQCRRVLVLGVGGGTVLQQLAQLFPKAILVGVELDQMHLRLAKRFFLPRSKRIQLIHADALVWIKKYHGHKFDLIIDDMFTEQVGEPRRVAAAALPWFNALLRHTTAQGMLVFNFLCARELRRCAYLHNSKLQRQFAAAYRLTTPVYENNIGVFLRQPAGLQYWRAQLQQHVRLAKEFHAQRHKYRISKLTVL
jgi:spermidine synthase